MKIDYEEGTAIYDQNIVGASTKQTYLGRFKFKCILNPIEIMDSDRIYREWLGNNSVMASESAINQAFALSQLKFRVIDCPPYWYNSYVGGGHIVDKNVIVDVLNKAIEAQNDYTDKKDKDYKELQKKLSKKIKSGIIKKQDEEMEETKKVDVNTDGEIEVEDKDNISLS